MATTANALHMMPNRLKYAFRSLLRRPVQALVVVSLLTVGFAAAGSVFTFLRGVVLSPFPYSEPDRITYLYISDAREGGAGDRWSWSGPDYLDLKWEARSFEALGAFAGGSFNWTGAGFAERVRGLTVTPAYFEVFGVSPMSGRLFSDSDLREQRDVAIVSRGFWENRLDADPHVLGRTLHLNGREKTIVGVMPERFRHIGADVWTVTRSDFAAMDRAEHPWYLMARLRPDVAMAAAEQELAAIRSAMAEVAGNRYPEYGHAEFRLNPLTDVIERSGPTIAMLAAGVVLLLLLSWLNVGHLLMTRGLDRRAELAVRMACGAKRVHGIADMLTETLLLFVPAVVAGFIAAAFALKWLVGLVPARPEGLEYIPPEAEIAVDPAIFLVLVGFALVGVAMAGLLPALRASNVPVAEVLKAGTQDAGGSARLLSVSQLLTAGQFALAAVLLSGAALLLQTLFALQRVDLGFRPEAVTTFQLALPSSRYGTPEVKAGFYRALTEALRARPAVQDAGATHIVPLQGFDMRNTVALRGRAEVNEGRPIDMLYSQVTPGYLATLEIPVLQGRDLLDSDDRQAPPVALVNRAFAERYFRNAAVAGEFLRVGNADQPWRRIVGVVGDVRQFDIERPIEPEVYVPHAQSADPRGWMVVTLRPASPETDLAPMIRETVRSMDAALPAFMIRDLESFVSASLGVRQLAGVLAVAFAATALMIALLGIFGVMSQSVSRRRRELGLRGALGATRARLGWMVLRQALAVASAGAFAGLALAVFLHRWLESLLYEPGAVTPFTYLLTGAGLLLAGGLAAAVPAWRASAVEPARALQHE